MGEWLKAAVALRRRKRLTPKFRSGVDANESTIHASEPHRRFKIFKISLFFLYYRHHRYRSKRHHPRFLASLLLFYRVFFYVLHGMYTGFLHVDVVFHRFGNLPNLEFNSDKGFDGCYLHSLIRRASRSSPAFAVCVLPPAACSRSFVCGFPRCL